MVKYLKRIIEKTFKVKVKSYKKLNMHQKVARLIFVTVASVIALQLSYFTIKIVLGILAVFSELALRIVEKSSVIYYVENYDYTLMDSFEYGYNILNNILGYIKNLVM